MSAGVFLEAGAALDALLRERKAIVRASWPAAAYLEHPPHCTLIAGAFAPVERWLASLGAALGGFAPFELTAAGTECFANDPLTGGTTVAIGVRASPALGALQTCVAQALAPWRDVAAAERLAASLADARAAASARAFGAAWVGAHWRPHFTVASLPVPVADLPETLLAPVAAMTVTVRAVTVWRIAGDAHERVAELPLGAARGSGR